MVIPEYRMPRLARPLPLAFDRTLRPIEDLFDLSPTVDVGPGIDRVLEHSPHVVVARRRPAHFGA